MGKVFSKQEGKNSLLGYLFCNHTVYFERTTSCILLL